MTEGKKSSKKKEEVDEKKKDWDVETKESTL